MDAMSEYGHHLGIIFQIMDDILDVEAPETLGKPQGQDILEGKPTLPLILAYEHATPTDKTQMDALFSKPDTRLTDLQPFLDKTNALSLSRQEAKISGRLAKDCLLTLPDSPYKQALADLVDFAMTRQH